MKNCGKLIKNKKGKLKQEGNKTKSKVESKFVARTIAKVT